MKSQDRNMTKSTHDKPDGENQEELLTELLEELKAVPVPKNIEVLAERLQGLIEEKAKRSKS